MPDILIRGMEMPTQDALLHIHADGRAVFYPFCVLDEVTEYEAIELPPHGRLIDADKFAEAKSVNNSAVIMDLAEAPTIVPASKEESE